MPTAPPSRQPLLLVAPRADQLYSILQEWADVRVFLFFAAVLPLQDKRNVGALCQKRVVQVKKLVRVCHGVCFGAFFRGAASALKTDLRSAAAGVVGGVTAGLFRRRILTALLPRAQKSLK